MAPLVAELLGTVWLVLGGCGSAVLAATFPETGIGFVGVSLAFGLTVLTGRTPSATSREGTSILRSRSGLAPRALSCVEGGLPYVVSQVLGAVRGLGRVAGHPIGSGKADEQRPGGRGLRRERLRQHSPAVRPRVPRSICEMVMTVMFLVVILGRQTGGHRPTSRGSRHRSVAHADSPRQHPGDEHVREPGAEHWTGDFCRRLGASATVALLGCTNRRCRARGLARARAVSWGDFIAAIGG